MNPSETKFYFGAKHYLSVVTIFTLVVFCILAALDLETANKLTTGLRDATTNHFDWLFTSTVSLVLLVTIALIFHPNASMRIGRDDEQPEFSRLSWFAMLFSAGLASGLLYWGFAEPIIHFSDNPFLQMNGITPNSSAAATKAVTVTIFHWGLHGWGLYVLIGLGIGLSAYRFDRPLTFSAAMIPLLGEKVIAGWVGNIIDLLALYGTIFGVATSIGLAVGSMNATMEPLLGVEFSLFNQISIVIIVCTLGIFSVLSGVSKGIRRLSEVNIWISLGLMLTFLILGPTVYLLKSLPANTADYLINVIPMGWWTASTVEDRSWQSAWSVFYWGWWLAWTPFVALFIARISRGRTIREFIVTVLFVPTLVVIIWMSIHGGTALHQEIQVADSVSAIVANDYSQGLVATIQNLDYPSVETLLLIVTSFLLFTWLITSLDSATLVICHILQVDHLGRMKIFWGFILGAVTCTLMLIGGVTALQAASIIIGLPMAVMVLLMGASVVKLVLELDP
jgi:choline/glycine/proline betaine transport protein